MKIILANPRGFCAGVNMAIESLEQALDFFGAPVYVYHEIVHNKYVVERFLRRGTVFVESLDEVPEGAPLLYSAHGVSPQVREQARRRKLRAIDATCPLVTKVHLEAVKYAREGYTIILIGHEGHDEVVGTMGEAPDRMVLVETAEDVERLEVPDPDKVAYLTQTTLSVDDANVVIAALRKKFPRIANPPKDDICYATQNRQEAVRRAGVAVRRRARPGQSEQLQQQAPGRDRPVARPPVAPDRRRHGDPAGVVRGGGDRPDHRGRQRPEDVVQECIAYLQGSFGATIQEEWVREENVHFPLPKSLRELLPASASADVEGPLTGHRRRTGPGPDPESRRPQSGRGHVTRTARPSLRPSPRGDAWRSG